MNDNAGTILLVEDDQNDVFFIQYAFEVANITNPLQIVGDGQQAIDYLRGAGKYADRSRFAFPSLVLLDLKLPMKMGIDVLKWMHSQPSMRNLLVLVLTSSSNVEDIDEAYRFGARSYLVKPLSVEDRLEMARLIKSYWLDLNQFPSIPVSAPSGPGAARIVTS